MSLSLPKDNTHASPTFLRPVQVPGSKSITNRALLLAALAWGAYVLWRQWGRQAGR